MNSLTTFEAPESTHEELVVVEDVRAVLRGEPDAFNRLYEKYRDMVYRVAMRRVRNPSSAEDVTQAVFLQVSQKIGTLRDHSRFPQWLRKIAVHLSVNLMVRRGAATSLAENATETLGKNDHSFLIAEKREVWDFIQDAMQRLRPIYREALIDFYFHGKQVKKIAFEKGIPIGTVKRRLSHARQFLRKLLSELHPTEFPVGSTPGNDVS